MSTTHLLDRVAAAALANRDLAAFAETATESPHLAETRLGNQIPETITLVSLAKELGAPAASSFGAGFGGSVWALVETTGADGFATDWLAAYRRRCPAAGERASALSTVPSPPAERLTPSS